MAPSRKTLIILGVVALLAACAIGVVALTSPGASQTLQPLTSPTQPPADPIPTTDVQTVPDDNEKVYSLSDLEAVHDFLTDYMDQYSILVLDADQAANRVDVCLKVYTQENMEQIRALVHDRYPDMDGCLHFQDYSGITISFTSDPGSATP